MSDSNNNGATIRPDANNNGATIRPSSAGGDNGATIRPATGGGNNGATIRPTTGAGGGGATVRPATQGATVRPSTGGGGNGATVRPATQGGTLRPDDSAKPVGGEGKTLRQDSGDPKLVAGANGANVGQADKKAVADVTRTHEDSYTLNGLRYKVKSVISESTGEAIVLLVENGGNQYVLKLYYPGISPNHDILEKVKAVRAMNLLVATVDHGVWCKADNKNGKDVSDADRSLKRDFELMLYYPWGSLDKLDLVGNEKRLRDYFVNMAAAINLCHTKGFLHRDIKPGNFLFGDKDKKTVVLGDFGIAVNLGSNGVAVTNQARTKVYAAPESYISTEGEVDITPKSDFYSLGMTLICLWMGEQQFASQVGQNERALASMKTYGKLPYPTGMSDHMLSLIMALTAPDPQARPDFAQITEWVNGKDPFLHFLGQKQQQEEKEKGFEILFNGAKNLVAHSPEELARLMKDDPTLGIKFLYSGRVSKWMEEQAGRPELALDVEDIVEKKYPKEQQAGLYATCLLLDPDMPYTDVQQRQLRTSAEIADSLIRNFDTYKTRLNKATDDLYIYMSVSGQEALAKQAVKDFQNSSVDDNEALRRLIYKLDPSRPYVIKDKNGKYHLCSTPDDIIRLSSHTTFDQECMKGLYDESFYTWLGARNKGLVAKVKKAIAELPKNSTIRFVTVLYNLNPKVSYYMELDPASSDYVFTHTQLAELFNNCLDEYAHEPKDSSRWKSADRMLTDINNIDDTLLYAYLKSKEGRYDQWITWIRECTNVKSQDNQKKAGPYNWRLGTYKAIRGMGVTPYYRFPKCGKKVTSVKELDNIPKAELKEELDNGMLADWLAVFYQEDPSVDYSSQPKYTFEKKTEAYTEKLGELSSDYTAYVDFHDAQRQVTSMAGKLKSMRAQLITLRSIVAVCCFIPIAGLILMLLFNGLPWTENPMPGWSGDAMSVMTIIFGVFVMFSGDIFDDGCLTGILASLFGGFVCALIVYYALYLALAFIMPFAAYIIIALLLLLGWFIYDSCYRKPSLNISQNKGLFDPQFEEKVLEPLDYAYNRNDKDFDSSIFDKSNQYLTDLKDGRKKLFFRAIPISIVTAALLFFFISFTYGDTFHLPSFGSSSSASTEQLNRLRGQWNGTFDGRNATIDVYSVNNDGSLSAVVYVKYRTLLKEAVVGTVNLEAGEIFFDDLVTNDRLDGTYSGVLDDSQDVMTISGTYTNKKSGKQVSFEVKKSKDSRDNASGTLDVLNAASATASPASGTSTSSASSSTSSSTASSTTESSTSTATQTSTSSQQAEQGSKAKTQKTKTQQATGDDITELMDILGDVDVSTQGNGITLEDVNVDDLPVELR